MTSGVVFHDLVSMCFSEAVNFFKWFEVFGYGDEHVYLLVY